MSEPLAVPVYECPKVATPPVIDGNLDDEVWQTVPLIKLVLAQTGQAASKETIVRICWDDDNLYISYACEDRDVWSTFTERDDPIFNQECCEAFLCPSGDLNTYFEINVSPRNVIFDAIIVDPLSPDRETDTDWDCEELRSAVQVDGNLELHTQTDKGWYAEMAIPFAGLNRATPVPGERWRGNFFRIERSPLEYQAWSPTLCTPANFHVPDRFGEIVFRG